MKAIASLIFLLCFLTSFSQDIITKKDGSILKARVVDILDDVIKYKKIENMEGPTYQLSVDKVSRITYENGTTDIFSENSVNTEDAEREKSSSNQLDDENFKRSIEGMAKDAGEQLIERCSGVKDNFGTDIYWDGVYKNIVTGEITIPIRVWWNKKWAPDGNKKWIKGKIDISPTGEKKWTFQGAEGIGLDRCGKNFKFK